MYSVCAYIYIYIYIYIEREKHMTLCTHRQRLLTEKIRHGKHHDAKYTTWCNLIDLW